MPRRALIVDDEPAVCQLIQGVLGSSGMDSLTLTKSAEAAGYLRDEKFDVVLLDFAMPAPSGIELAQQARGSGFNQKTPIIMISDDQPFRKDSTPVQASSFISQSTSPVCKG
jgi:DNA-binding response OmpR family regulator